MEVTVDRPTERVFCGLQAATIGHLSAAIGVRGIDLAGWVAEGGHTA